MGPRRTRATRARRASRRSSSAPGFRPGAPPTAREVAFRIAPRLNAAGRLDHARRALELLTTTDAARAEALAGRAGGRQRRSGAPCRSTSSRPCWSGSPAASTHARRRRRRGGRRESTGWHRGVLGIAASRVAERVRRPVLLFAREGDRVSGSGRTSGRTPLYERVAPVAARFASEFGGHDAALGLTLPAGAWEAFCEALRASFAEARDDSEWESRHPRRRRAHGAGGDGGAGRRALALRAARRRKPAPSLPPPRPSLGRPRAADRPARPPDGLRGQRRPARGCSGGRSATFPRRRALRAWTWPRTSLSTLTRDGPALEIVELGPATP